MKSGFGPFKIAGAAGLAMVAAAAMIPAAAPSIAEPGLAAEQVTDIAPPAVRRLNEQQYLRSIRDIFGSDIKVPGRFEPPVREDGLLAIGEGRVAVSSSGFEQHELRAREIASQVLAESRREQSVPCVPASPSTFVRSCAQQFVTKYGRLLYRRDLTEAEIAAAVGVAELGALNSGDFYKGLELALARLLVSPNFIFRIEDYEPDPEQPGAWRLTDYSLASRISFLFWDAPPDEALLDAAASGALRTQAGLGNQIDRLLASPRFEDGARGFFADMFGYEQFDAVTKDQSIFPIYTSQLAKDAKEQTLRTIVDLLVAQDTDYRELFTTRKTYMNRSLGGLYDVPVSTAAVDGWAPFTFGDDDNRAGLLSLAAFLMLDTTHEGRTSPTIRGKTVREMFLCQPVPNPPGNVNFALVQDVNNPLYKTARGRLTAHREDPVCAGCHAITDPIGLSLEHYNGVGQYRETENGALIDASGTFEGSAYGDAIELQRLLRSGTTASDCVAQRVFEYGTGRALEAHDYKAVDQLAKRFGALGYRFPALLREVALSEAFRSVAAPALASK